VSRPPCCPEATGRRVHALRAQQLSYRNIARALNAESVPTPAGSARWYPSHVFNLVHTRWFRHLSATLESDVTAVSGSDVATATGAAHAA
jgi:hypothetical protein